MLWLKNVEEVGFGCQIPTASTWLRYPKVNLHLFGMMPARAWKLGSIFSVISYLCSAVQVT